MKIHVFESEQIVRAPIDEVFAFFSRAENLERITPPSLRFEITTPKPIDVRAGTLIDYRLRLHGVPFRWRTRIDVFEPGRRFVDVQLRGPYALWRHEHLFEPLAGDPRSTRMRDRVEYALPFGPLGEIARRLFVGREVAGIFSHRAKVIEEIFRATAHPANDGDRASP